MARPLHGAAPPSEVSETAGPAATRAVRLVAQTGRTSTHMYRDCAWRLGPHGACMQGLARSSFRCPEDGSVMAEMVVS